VQQAQNGAVSLRLSARFSSLTYVFLFSHDALPVSIFAFLSLGLIPIPLVFIRYGKDLRASSRFSEEARHVIKRMSVMNKAEGMIIEKPNPLATLEEKKEDSV
jgi:hypothetical protein